MVEKNLLKLAKGTKKTTSVKEAVEKPKSLAEERDIKAKRKVEELLHDVPLVIEKKEELLEVDNSQENVSVDWLEEQITLLSEKNNELNAEFNLLKADYAKLLTEKDVNVVNDGVVIQNVIKLFNEIQENHIKLGSDSQTGIGNFRIYCPGFLNRMILFFPFLANEKRY
jgi:hypothetical protein